MNTGRKGIVILLLIVILGAFLRSYKLGDESFFRDEFFDLNTSYGFHKTGEWLAWDFNTGKPFPSEIQSEYSNTRAQIYRYPLAALYYFAEPTETLTRMWSVFWGIISILLVYYFALSLTGNIGIALIASFLVAISGTSVVLDRRLRMYSMFFPAYLLLSWLIFKFFESAYDGKKKILAKLYEKTKLNFFYLAPLILTGLVSYELHELTAGIAVALAAYCLIFAAKNIAKKNYLNKYTVTFAILALGCLLVTNFIGSLYKLSDKSIRFFRFNGEYYALYFDDWKIHWFGLALALLGAWLIIKKLNKQKAGVFLACSAFGLLLFAILSWIRYPVDRYTYFFLSFAIVLEAAGIYALIILVSEKYQLNKKITTVAAIALFLGMTNFWYFSGQNGIYRQRDDFGHYDFRKIFSYISENRKPEDVYVTRSYRSYYWKNENVAVFDVKSLPFEKNNCEELIEKIISENKGGWVILPEIDDISVCSGGRKYLADNLERIKNGEIAETVFVYRWGK